MLMMDDNKRLMDFKVDQLLYKTHNDRSCFRYKNSLCMYVCMCGIELKHVNTAWQACHHRC